MNETTEMVSFDPWNIGSSYKLGIWSFYILTNYIGVLLCLLLIYVVLCNKKRSSSDIFTCGLSTGCLSMSITCGTQCLANAIGNKFIGYDKACNLEAIAHISSILTEFFNVAFISINMYYSVVKKKEIQQNTSFKIIIAIWLICTISTCLASLEGKIYLMSAGTYCFFAFDSVAITGLLIPGLIISLTIMISCHFTIVNHLSKMLPTSVIGFITVGGIKSPVISQQDIWTHQFRWRSTLFILALILGWGFAAVTTIHELAIGETPEWLVTAVGVCGVLFSVWVPLIFFLYFFLL